MERIDDNSLWLETDTKSCLRPQHINHKKTLLHVGGRERLHDRGAVHEPMKHHMSVLITGLGEQKERE